ncbi:Protein of unknown function [Gryllus bimaculatus]|nr:Protein of unknown function [Gryllus bimaculatus]
MFPGSMPLDSTPPVETCKTKLATLSHITSETEELSGMSSHLISQAFSNTKLKYILLKNESSRRKSCESSGYSIPTQGKSFPLSGGVAYKRTFQCIFIVSKNSHPDQELNPSLLNCSCKKYRTAVLYNILRAGRKDPEPQILDIAMNIFFIDFKVKEYELGKKKEC